MDDQTPIAKKRRTFWVIFTIIIICICSILIYIYRQNISDFFEAGQKIFKPIGKDAIKTLPQQQVTPEPTITVQNTIQTPVSTVVNIQPVTMPATIKEIFTPKNDLSYSKIFGGTQEDMVYSAFKTIDNGYIISGTTNSYDIDIKENKGYKDVLLAKFDSKGNIEWSKTYGGSDDDLSCCIIQTANGEYVSAGSTKSPDKDIKNLHIGDQNNRTDIWIFKTDSNGNIMWQRTLGGSGNEYAKSITETTDGGLLVLGTTNSADGDISINYGENDIWLIKLSKNGAIEWQKSYGGNKNDEGVKILSLPDESITILGNTNSDDERIKGNHSNGFMDILMIHLDKAGNILWQKCFGGSENESPADLIVTPEKNYVVLGRTTSSDNSGDVKDKHSGFDFNNNSTSDIWLLNISNEGVLINQKCFGGSRNDEGKAILQETDGNFIVLGDTNSDNGDMRYLHKTLNNQPETDSVIIKLNRNFEIINSKLIGGTKKESSAEILLTEDNPIYFINTESFDGDIINKYSGTGSDIFIFKTK